MPKDYITINQFEEFKEEMRDFKKAVFDQYDLQKEEYKKQLGAIMENNAHWAKFIVESLKMNTEGFERKFGLNDEEHRKFDKRISKVESKWLGAA